MLICRPNGRQRLCINVSSVNEIIYHYDVSPQCLVRAKTLKLTVVHLLFTISVVPRSRYVCSPLTRTFVFISVDCSPAPGCLYFIIYFFIFRVHFLGVIFELLLPFSAF